MRDVITYKLKKKKRRKHRANITPAFSAEPTLNRKKSASARTVILFSSKITSFNGREKAK